VMTAPKGEMSPHGFPSDSGELVTRYGFEDCDQTTCLLA